MRDADETAFFAFHASAFAWGGQITRPFSEVLEVQAATTLPSTGGFGSARVEKYNYRDLIRFESAHSVVTGSSTGDVRHTLATAIIEGLNIMNMVTADRVVARMTSSHKLADPSGKRASQLPLGSHFVNLQVGGVPVNPTPYDVLMCEGKLCELEGDPRFSDVTATAQASSPKDREVVQYRRFDDCRVMSIFQDLEIPNAPFVTKPGCVIQVEDFGSIALGRCMRTGESLRLTMISLELGSPVDMNGGGSDIIINGSPS